eukprot:scaffold141973_cov31-Tisochrysis_lutea.AAC.2
MARAPLLDHIVTPVHYTTSCHRHVGTRLGQIISIELSVAQGVAAPAPRYARDSPHHFGAIDALERRQNPDLSSPTTPLQKAAAEIMCRQRLVKPGTGQ